MSKIATPQHPKTYVVLGPGHGKMAGKIKSIPLAENIASPLIDWKDGVARISTREEKAKTGTEFLGKLYAAEGRMAHWEARLAWQAAVDAGRTVKPFPDSLLPAKVLAWRSDSGEPDGPFDVEAFVAASAKPKAEKAEKAK